MSRLGQLSTNSDELGRWWGIVLLFLGGWLILAYISAWMTHDSVSLTLNAYDLAEWTTLTPAQRSATPPLMAALWLRLQMVVVTLVVVWGAMASGGRGLAFGLLIIGGALQLPPPDFVFNLDDVNYQQQFFLAVLSLFLGGAVIRRGGLPLLMGAMLGGVGVGGSVAGFDVSMGVLAPFAIEISVGMGYWMVLMGYGALIVLSLVSGQIKRSDSSNVKNNQR